MLRECRLALVFIILGGAFNAYVNLFYYAPHHYAEQKRIFLGLRRCDGQRRSLFFALRTRQDRWADRFRICFLTAAPTACFLGLTSLVMYRETGTGYRTCLIDLEETWRLIFAVGPVQMDEEIRAIGAEEVPYFRTPEFSAIMKENERLMKQFTGAPEDARAVFLTGSGTAAMEAAVMNLLRSATACWS